MPSSSASGNSQPFWRQRRTQSSPSNTLGLGVEHAQASLSTTDLSNHAVHGLRDGQVVSEIVKETDLDSLNTSLQMMCHVFPDVRPEVFRELLSTFSPESRLQLAVESVLRGKSKLVKGRWRIDVGHPKSRRRAVPSTQRRLSSTAKEKASKATTTTQNSGDPGSPSPLPLLAEDKFRTEEYKGAVKSVLYQEFKALSRSTVKAVLAEHNYSYTNSRPTLIALTSKSWRWSLANLFGKRNKTPLPTDHPLLVWHPSKSSGMMEPSLRFTPSDELNHELEQTLIAPLHARRLADQLEQDRKLAQLTNDAEAEKVGAMFDCQCCFTASAFENMTTCADGGHFMCSRCVSLTLGEAVFGQGWASSVDTTRSTLKCFALSDDGSSQECGSCIPRQQVKRVLCTDRDGEDTWKKFEDRLASDSLASMGALLSKCAFCSYAEIYEPLDEAHNGLFQSSPGLQSRLVLTLGLLSSLAVFYVISGTLLFFFLMTILPLIVFAIAAALKSHGHGQALRDLLRLTRLPVKKQPEYATHHGQKFTCRNPSCSRISCLRCSAAWQDVHVCHRSARLALRTYIESAVTEAVKRTCPKCHVSFIKASGCNKLICVCGYSMCYLCRKEIGPREGYAHFCPHFRSNPGEDCDKCDRCDLYRTENEDIIIERARATAIKQWQESHESLQKGGNSLAASSADLALSVDIDVFDDANDDNDDDDEDDLGLNEEREYSLADGEDGPERLHNDNNNNNNNDYGDTTRRGKYAGAAASLVVKRNNGRLRSVFGMS